MMRNTRTLLTGGLAAVMLQAAAAAELGGDYIGEVRVASTIEPDVAHVQLQVEGSAVTGRWGDRLVTGTASGSKLSLTLTEASGATAGTLRGQVTSRLIEGDGAVTRRPVLGIGGRAPTALPEPVTWTLTRHTPPAAGRQYTFEPKSFYTTYSAGWAPVLRLHAGDTVSTRTYDAERDAGAVRYGAGGNPSTGPFYVEGALPGDTLVVHLKRVRTNKVTARQGTRMNMRAVTAAYLVGAQYDPAVTGEWTLDLAAGVARLAQPTPRMKDFRVPIRTMLGCVSVAPPGADQARGTDLGVYGGNLDYNDNVEGTTLYFPVFHAGALFGIGDAHAAMGDGEVTGSALETSADVEFTVEVLRGQSYPQVRAETADYLISFGVSGSVAESIQAATTQLTEWLKQDYGLSDSEVAVFLGAVLKYDIAELVDPHLNVVAKVPKAALATFARR